ncbi:MAG: hypothetical protein VSS52_012905, partial [Thiotrichaceae bacterium]|nr:hypothetical protein [Thiotrichaceae bacterium]
NHYQQAIELGTALPLDNPQYRNQLATAYNNCGIALANLRHFEEAEDVIEESLTILRQLEQQGIHWFRENRERFFANAITFYLTGDSFNFLPELILEHLDPINEGAAAQSEKMHQAALRGLLQLYRRIYYSHPQLIIEIQQTIERLAEIRAKYFAGTANGAKLTAQFYEEHVGDINKAEEILKTYTEQVKDDPEGYKQLADFYTRRNNIDQALNFYQQALQTILQQPLEMLQQQAITEMLTLIYLLIAQPAKWKTESAVNDSLNKINDWYADWIRTLAETIYNTIKPLHKTALQHIEAQRQQWRELKKSTEFQKQIQQRVEIQIHITLQAIQVLPPSLQIIVDILLNAQKQLWQDDMTLEKEEKTVEDRIEALQNTLISQLHKLPEAELKAAETQLQQAMPTLWEKLTPEEQQFLKFGMRLYQDKIYIFAGVSFGSAIENTLKIHLFQPAKQRIQHEQLPVEYRHEQDFIAGFFDSKARLMLGNLIGGFNQTFHNIGKKTHETNANHLRNHLSHYQPDTATQKRRAEKLEQILKLRNQLHNSPEQSQQNVTDMIDMVYQNSQDGFYRYFLTALESNNEHTQITG